MRTRPFIHEDFLLRSATARELYHGFAKGRPIVDYHCHLSPEALALDRPFGNLSRLWLADHYKWRAMRAAGVPERLITGDATDREKFDAYAATVPQLLGNPLYHWTHMELADPFGLDDLLLGPATAGHVWDACNARLADAAFTPRALMQRAGMRVICTTDDPADSLEHHRALAASDFPVTVLPTFRPDRALAIDALDTWNAYIDRLAQASGTEIATWDDLLVAYAQRADAFAACGCRLADLGISEPYAVDYALAEVRTAFTRARSGQTVDATAVAQFRSALLFELGCLYHDRGWTSQMHIGAMRNNRTRAMRSMGADSGHDSIGDAPIASGLARMLDRLDAAERLPRTILYNLNPAKNDVFATLIGNLQGDETQPGRLQYGPAWWFLDQFGGIVRQLETVASMGVLSRFIGMVTDSRSFLSYSRHDYFRRILCDFLGAEVDAGRMPCEMELLGSTVEAICFKNALNFFDFPSKEATR